MPDIIVIERKARWTPELQRQVNGTKSEAFSITSCCNWSGLRPQKIAAGTLIVIDVNFGVAECLHFLSRMLPHLDGCAVVVIGSQATHLLEWIFYEMGVAVYLADCDHGEKLICICHRLVKALTSKA